MSVLPDLRGERVTRPSVVHRTRPGVKLLLLCLFLAVVLGIRTPAAVVAGTVATAALAAVAHIPVRTMLRQLRPSLLFALSVGGLQTWSRGPVAGVSDAAALLVAVAAAALVTLTTRTEDLLDALVTAVRPLRPLGVDPERVALTLALAVNSLPVIARLAAEVQQARMARGAERSVRAFAVPLVIRTVRHADRLGEALRARGVDDDPAPDGEPSAGEPGRGA